MGILAWIVFGFVVGLIARALMPGDQKMGIVLTTLLGVAGAFVGGLVGNLVMHRDPFILDSAGFVGSVLGAVVLLFLVGMTVGRSGRFGRTRKVTV